MYDYADRPLSGDTYRIAESPPTPNIRQQHKLIAVMVRGSSRLFSEDSVDLNTGEKDQFFKKIATGEITPDTAKGCISSIKANYVRYSSGDMFKALSGYENVQQIKACIADAISAEMVNNGQHSPSAFKNRDSISAKELQKLILLYPEPITLDTKLQALINIVEQYNEKPKADQYRRSLRVLMRVVYGKQQEYWEQFQLLNQEAKAKASSFNQQDRAEAPPKSNESQGSQQPIIIQNEGKLKRSVADMGDVSVKKERERDDIDAARVATILQVMTSLKKVPLIYQTDQFIYLRSIPENPHISDIDAEKIIALMGSELKSVLPNIETGDLKRKLLGIFQPATFARFKDAETPDGFETKNAIYRNLVKHVNEPLYFENL